MYFKHPEKLMAETPEKYKAMKEFYEPGLYDKVMDRAGIRRLGKKLAQLIDKVPGLRTALGVVGAVTGPVSLRVGSGKVEEGIRQGDKLLKYNGKMSIAQGLAFTTKVLSPIGLGIALFKWLTDKRIEKGKMTPEQADKLANATLALMMGPFGMTYLAATQEMLKGADKKDESQFEYNKLKDMSGTSQDDKSTGKTGDVKKETIFKRSEILPLVGYIAGAACGIWAGAVIGGLHGLALGAIVGKGLATIGASAFSRTQYAVSRPFTGDDVTEKSKLTLSDGLYMAGISTASAIGGTAGTVLGYAGGSAIGAAVGGIAGPLGAGIGALLGKVVGVMSGSYTGAKIGAKAAGKVIG